MTKEQFEHELNSVLADAYRYCLRLARGSREEAEDILQESSIAAFRGRDGFRLGSNFKAWFFKITTNQFFKRGARQSFATISFPEQVEPFLYSSALEKGISMEADPLETVLANVDNQLILNALDSLPEDFRIACSLYFVSEMPYEDISEALDVPIGTVRSRLHRGRKMLQHKLWEVAEQRGVVGGANYAG